MEHGMRAFFAVQCRRLRIECAMVKRRGETDCCYHTGRLGPLLFLLFDIHISTLFGPLSNFRTHLGIVAIAHRCVSGGSSH